MNPSEPSSGFAAYLYDGKSAARRAATVKLSVPGYLVVQELGSVSRFRLEDIELDPRIGSQPARMQLPDGASVEVQDAESFYSAYAAVSGRRQILHLLESRWVLVLAVLVLTVAAAWSFYHWGIPAVVRGIAFSLPRDIDAAIGAEGLAALDRSGLQPTELSEPRRLELAAVFADVVATLGSSEAGDAGSVPEVDFQLEFRGGGPLGANALALPAGYVILTDELVALAEDDAELAAVLAHEVGHVLNRHSLRALLQNSVVAGLVLLVTGDISAADGLAAQIPLLLASAGYSREFENEADQVAKAYLVARGIPLRCFADIILRLEDQSDVAGAITGLLATHPAAVERARNFR